MDRIVFHWTAGRHVANAGDRKHYHILIEGTGDLVRGPSIALNASPVRPGYAAHTLNCNGGAIGVALCGMIGAQERPFDPGTEPITQAQWDKLALVIRDLCRFYGIPVSPRTVLSHAEVQRTLGIKQRAKWDVARLPFDLGTVGATDIGDEMRAATLLASAKGNPNVPTPGLVGVPQPNLGDFQ
jgi:N-acetyl-anhydromuramyl-L-alanine amidase AmpD